MIDKPGLNIRIPIVIPTKGRGFINQGSTLGYLQAFEFALGKKQLRLFHVENAQPSLSETALDESIRATT